MATFYGTIKGARGVATKTGTKASGIKVSAQSWGGSVIVRLCDAGAEKPIKPWLIKLGKYVFCLACIITLVAGVLLGGIG